MLPGLLPAGRGRLGPQHSRGPGKQPVQEQAGTRKQCLTENKNDQLGTFASISERHRRVGGEQVRRGPRITRPRADTPGTRRAWSPSQVRSRSLKTRISDNVCSSLGIGQSPWAGGVTASLTLRSTQTEVNEEITKQFIAAGNFECAVQEKFESLL